MVQGEDIGTSPVILKPGVGSSYDNGWKYLWKNFGELLVSGIICLALILPVSVVVMIVFSFGIQDTFNTSTDIFSGGFGDIAFFGGYQIIFNILNIVYWTPITYGLLFVYMTAARGEKVEFSNIFASFKNYGNVILVGVLYAVVSFGIGMLLQLITWVLPLLGIPLSIIWYLFCIFLYCKLAFVPYLLLDKRIGAVDSIKESWRMTNGHFWKVFLIGLLGIPIMIAGFICLIIGSIISMMWITMAIGSLYHAIDTQGKEALVAQPSPIIE